MSADKEKIERLLGHNVEETINKEHLRAALLAGKKLRIKLGIDPTSPDLHLGHAVVLKKLREFQDLGCVAVLVIGDFTAQIGDPSGRDKTRPNLTEAEIKENLKNYLKQAGAIIDLKKAEVVNNSKWLKELHGAKLLQILSLMTVQQIIERDDFQKRIAAHQPVRMHEIFYPIMQAYDSVAIEADVELGGTDQTFNLMTGRTLMERLDMKPQDVMTLPLLEGLDGKRKMSKSLGNYVGLTDLPADMFGKIMSLPDALMGKYFALCTDIPEKEVASLKKALKPKDLKERLGFEIVREYHGEISARAAREQFEKLFSKKEMPDDLPELKLKGSKMTALDIVLAAGGATSKSEGRRLIEQGGFELGGENINNPQAVLNLKSGQVIRLGKKRFFRVKV